MKQVEWELEGHDEGMYKFFSDQEQARLSGKTHETSVGTSVLRQGILGIGEALAESAAKPTAGKGGAYVQALRIAATRYNGEEFYQDYNIPAYIGLMTLLSASYSKSDSGKFLSNLAIEIGRRLEYDQQMYVFRQDNQAFIGKIEASLAEQGVTSLRHKLKTYQKKWRDAEMQWAEWGTVKQLHVGVRVIKAITATMDEYFVIIKKHNGKHARHYVETTLALDDFIVDETDLMSKTLPLRRPMLEQPLDWERVDGEIVGGFHTQELRRVTPFIKTKGKEHREFVDAAYPHKHITAVNHMQQTEWKIDPQMVKLVRAAADAGWDGFGLPRTTKLDLPIHPGDDAPTEEHMQWLVDTKHVHALNKKNSSELIVLGQSLIMTDKVADRGFWFAYTCDFRGRIYCTSTTLSPQGADPIKSMITFAEGKPLGREGIRWLAINGANKYGYDKDDYNGRVRWVMDNRESIRAVVADPTGSSSRSFLAGADKPFQFAAFCFEWAKCGYGTNPESVSHLPVGLDGSCNGLQHYGAMLRDVRGGKGVNLTDAKVPEDIYREVSDEFRRLLERDSGNPLAAQVLSLNPDRKCAKRPVMTLPYGSTQQSCRQYLFDWIEGENGTAAQLESRKLATYATPIMWEAIGNVVVAAREAMRWLQDASTVVARKGVYARWMSPADFPVYQHYSEYDTIRVRTDLFGKINILIQGSPCGVAKRKARNGVAPNFVHAMDASHMVLTILDAKARGIGSLAMIHDDFGTHASDIPELNEIIRQTFVRMYYDTNWLAKWRMEIQRLDDTLELPEPPEMGTLDVLDVLDSKYFFG